MTNLIESNFKPATEASLEKIWKLASEIAFWSDESDGLVFHHSKSSILNGGPRDGTDVVQRALNEVQANEAVRKKVLRKNNWEPLTDEESIQVIEVFRLLARWRDEAEEMKLYFSKSKTSEPQKDLAQKNKQTK